jgi:hypothetical protein
MDDEDQEEIAETPKWTRRLVDENIILFLQRSYLKQEKINSGKKSANLRRHRIAK